MCIKCHNDTYLWQARASMMLFLLAAACVVSCAHRPAECAQKRDHNASGFAVDNDIDGGLNSINNDPKNNDYH